MCWNSRYSTLSGSSLQFRLWWCSFFSSTPFVKLRRLSSDKVKDRCQQKNQKTSATAVKRRSAKKTPTRKRARKICDDSANGKKTIANQGSKKRKLTSDKGSQTDSNEQSNVPSSSAGVRKVECESDPQMNSSDGGCSLQADSEQKKPHTAIAS